MLFNYRCFGCLGVVVCVVYGYVGADSVVVGVGAGVSTGGFGEGGGSSGGYGC